MKIGRSILLFMWIVGGVQAQSSLQQRFDGRFQLYIKGKMEWQNPCFWEHLKPFRNDTCAISHKDHALKITILDSKRIRFSDVTDSCEEKSKVFHYYRDGDTVIIPKHRNRWFMGVPPFFFATGAQQLKLSINEDKNLVLAYHGGSGGMVFPIAAGTHTDGTEVYKRK